MTNEILNMMSDNSRFPYERLQELNDINSRIFSRMTDLHMSLARLGIEGSVEQARLFTGAKKYEDLLSAETDLASSYSDKVMELTREATGIITESQEELLSWMEKRFEDGKKEVKQAVAPSDKPKPAAKKPAAPAKSSRKKVA
ncbi:MAG: phasin family protein [Gammaproteobacteria bacterium]